MNQLSKNDFFYDVPEELIAQKPLERRGESKLLCVRDAEIKDEKFLHLPEILTPGTLLITNNTRVFPARIHGKSDSGGQVELLLLSRDPSSRRSWWCIGRPVKKLRVGKKIHFENLPGFAVLVREPERKEDQVEPFLVEFPIDQDAMCQWLDQYGEIPLPPYIKREDQKERDSDKSRYQTVFSREGFSAAAPTASLHFTEEIIAELKARKIEMLAVTLDVGIGTFLPVKSDAIEKHVMHRERFRIPRQTWNAIEMARAEDRPVIAVGTTSFRATESFALREEKICDQWLETGLFIYPKFKDDHYRSKIFSGIITNFHQPESTLLMLISALMGFEKTREVYRHAIEEKYRFFSYGDSSLLMFGSRGS